jgi:nanoRNase/pAp phosphatase (c-di-AMP/oligoRNAs hydrolase)
MANDIAEKAKELEGILESIEGKVLIIDHRYGDPDSIASKYTWRFILKNKFSLDSDIGFCNESTDRQSQLLTKKLSLLIVWILTIMKRSFYWILTFLQAIFPLMRKC